MSHKDEMSAATPEDWAGIRGDKWLRELDVLEAMLAPVGEALLAQAALQPGESVADIGCGGGWTSRRAAQAVGAGGRVLGLDISPALVGEARARGHGLPQLSFRVADASCDTPPEAPFDRLMSRFGVMFFPDPPLAYRHLASLLRPGGRADFAIWADPRRNPWMMEMRAAVGTHVALPRQEPLAPGPFQLADPDYLDALLEGAGFTHVERRLVEIPLLQGGPGSTPADAARFAVRALAIGEVLEAAGPDTTAAAMADLEAMYARHQTADGVAMQGAFWLVEARRTADGG